MNSLVSASLSNSPVHFGIFKEKRVVSNYIYDERLTLNKNSKVTKVTRDEIALPLILTTTSPLARCIVL